MAATGSAALNTALPATSRSAPRATTSGAVLALMPPSTSMIGFASAALHSSTTCVIRSGVLSMNYWPPNPGCTLIIKTRSHLSTSPASTLVSVSGLIETPAWAPAA